MFLRNEHFLKAVVGIEALAEQVNTRLRFASALLSSSYRAEMLLDVLDLLVAKYQETCDLATCSYQRQEQHVRTEDEFVFLLADAFRHTRRMLRPTWCPDHEGLWLGLAPSACAQYDVSFLLEDARDLLLQVGLRQSPPQQADGLFITYAKRKRKYYYHPDRRALYLDTTKRLSCNTEIIPPPQP